MTRIVLSKNDLAETFLRKHRPLIRLLRARALADPWDGIRPPNAALHYVQLASPEDKERVLSIGLTYDFGTHNSGWWRNSEYDQCLHLGICGVGRISFFSPTESEVQAIARAFFGKDVTKTWLEPPASSFDSYRTAPQSRHSWHVRLFYDRTTKQPIQPEGEVYTLKPWAEGDSPEKVFR